MKKIRDRVTENSNIDKALELYDDIQGCFTGVDYIRRDHTNWMSLIHVDRLYDSTFAYAHPKSFCYQNEDLYHKIVKGLEYRHHRNPHCNNWWYNQIVEPQKLGILLIQVRVGKRQIPEVLGTKVLQRMRKDDGHPARRAGANRTDIALYWIYRACLQKNDVDLKTTVENIYSPLSYTVKEEFQYGNSYFQHSVQLYISGYGDEILKGVTQVTLYTKGTKYTLGGERI